LTQKLFDSGTILICAEIESQVAQSIVRAGAGVAAVSDDDITVFVHSPGGHVESSDTIHDVLASFKPRYVWSAPGGWRAAGRTSFLSAEREDRYCLPNTRFLHPQPAGGAGGPATDLEIEAAEIIKKMRAAAHRSSPRRPASRSEGREGHRAEL